MNPKDKWLVGIILSHVRERQDSDRLANASLGGGITKYKFVGNEVHDGNRQNYDNHIVERLPRWPARQFSPGVAF